MYMAVVRKLITVILFSYPIDDLTPRILDNRELQA
jgi:hypothetical protein